MSDQIEFTKNYTDHSTDNGFQFEFFCDRCGTGYRNHFVPYAVGSISSALETAGSLFGGVFNSVANASQSVKSAGWQKAKDNAFIAAAQELKPDFIQCPRCSSWVCKKSCWNNQRGLCKNCAPDMVWKWRRQASRTVEEIWEHSKVAEDDRAMFKGCKLAGRGTRDLSELQCAAGEKRQVLPGMRDGHHCRQVLQQLRGQAPARRQVLSGVRYETGLGFATILINRRPGTENTHLPGLPVKSKNMCRHLEGDGHI